MKMKPIVFGMIAALATTVGAYAQSPNLGRYDFRVINAASSTIMEVYVRNLATDRVYGDLLGSDVIPSGGVYRFSLNDGTDTCNWRLQVKLLDGRDLRKAFNVCNTTSVTVND
jgi:hypothetical protein